MGCSHATEIAMRIGWQTKEPRSRYCSFSFTNNSAGPSPTDSFTIDPLQHHGQTANSNRPSIKPTTPSKTSSNSYKLHELVEVLLFTNETVRIYGCRAPLRKRPAALNIAWTRRRNIFRNADQLVMDGPISGVTQVKRHVLHKLSLDCEAVLIHQSVIHVNRSRRDCRLLTAGQGWPYATGPVRAFARRARIWIGSDQGRSYPLERIGPIKLPRRGRVDEDGCRGWIGNVLLDHNRRHVSPLKRHVGIQKYREKAVRCANNSSIVPARAPRKPDTRNI